VQASAPVNSRPEHGHLKESYTCYAHTVESYAGPPDAINAPAVGDRLEIFEDACAAMIQATVAGGDHTSAQTHRRNGYLGKTAHESKSWPTKLEEPALLNKGLSQSKETLR